MTKQKREDLAARKVKILIMCKDYPASASQITPELLERFIEATLDCSLKAIELSIGQFSRGDVPGHNATFVPSVAEFSRNVRAWQVGIDANEKEIIRLHNGILSVDFGRGSIDMRGLTVDQQEEVFRTKRAPDPDVLRLEDGPGHMKPLRLRRM